MAGELGVSQALGLLAEEVSRDTAMLGINRLNELYANAYLIAAGQAAR